MSVFRFKQFSAKQSPGVFKIGTDGVLLGAWAPLHGSHHALEVGSGTGIVSLMLAQRFPELRLHAIDLDADAAELTAENMAASSFGSRLSAEHTLLQHLPIPDEPYDAVVCNPPYFEKSTPSPYPERQHARHTTSLPYETLVAESANLLKESGKLVVILPADSSDRFTNIAVDAGFARWREMHVHPLPSRAPKRILLAFQRSVSETEVIQTHLTLEESRGTFHPSYREMMQEFHPFL